MTSAPRALFDAIAARKTARMLPPDDTEMDCCECAGTGLQDGPDGAPCDWCNGTGMW